MKPYHLQYLFPILLIGLSSQYLFAQSYNLKHITTRDGLASKEVTGFIQDRQGFIWITTVGGLQRFDGEHFVTYRHSDKDSSSLFFDFVAMPVIDKEGTLWLKNPGQAVNRFNLESGKVKRLGLTSRGQNGVATYSSYCKDARGNIWIAGYKALFRYNYKGKKIDSVASLPDSLRCVFSGPMICDPVTGHLWIGTLHCIIEYDPITNSFHDFHFNPERNPIFDLTSDPFRLFVDKRRNLWFATWDWQLYRYNLQTRSFKKFKMPVILADGASDKAADRVAGLVQDSKNDVWIATEKGSVFKYDTKADVFNLVIQKLYGDAYTGGAQSLAMFADKEDNIWIGTDNGIFMFNPQKQKIFLVKNNPFTKFSFPEKQVEAFYETSNGLIFIASRDGGGVSVFDEQFRLINSMFYRDDHRNKAMAGNPVWSFCEDLRGKLWMVAPGILACYDLSTRRTSFLKVPEINSAAHKMVRDANGNIWIGVGQAIIKLNPLTIKYSVFKDLNERFKLAGYIINDILIDESNNFWVATRDGFFRFDPQYGKFVECFINSKNVPNNYSDDEVLCICKGRDEELLLGTSDGMEVFNMRTKKIIRLKFNEGTLSNVFKGVSTDSEGNIYAATFNGLYKIDAVTGNRTHYNYDDGITDDIFYTNIYRLRDGRMLAGGANSFVYFDPEGLKETFIPPDVRLTGFKVLNEQLQPLSSSNTISLNPDQNFITIQYASLYYNASAKIHYYYKLEGVDRNWVNAGNARAAAYTALGSGKYTFQIKGTNDDGIPSRRITTLYINIEAPYYKSWWFVLLCISASAGNAYVIYLNRAETRRHLAKIRGRIASDLHDDIGSTLNSISVYSEVAAQLLTDDTEKAKSILERMGSASRTMIDDMNDIVWSLNPKNDDFENILQRMQYFAGELLSAKNILLQFDIDENVKKITLPMDKRKNFYLIYKEAINNAYKYSESKNVNVSIAEKDRNLIMIITDNGRGFEIVKNGLGGNGLKNMKNRAREINADIDINSWPNKGTRVFVKMKM